MGYARGSTVPMPYPPCDLTAKAQAQSVKHSLDPQDLNLKEKVSVRGDFPIGEPFRSVSFSRRNVETTHFT
jgi:hypothetical protein